MLATANSAVSCVIPTLTRARSSAVIGPVRNGLALAQARKVVRQYPRRLSLSLPGPARIAKGSNLLFFLGIDRDHRIPTPPERLRLPVDVAELRIPIRMLFPLDALDIALQGVPHLPQTTAHRHRTHRMSLSGQLGSHGARRL